MDPLAHTLCGAALHRARLVPSAPLVGATLLIAASGPDVDALTYVFGDRVDAMLHRRGWTHALSTFTFQIPLFALVMYAVARGRARSRAEPPRFRPILAASALGYLSHLGLDLLNTYGVRFLLPFTDRWFHGDAAFIVDPWMWLLLGAATLFGGGVRPWGYLLWLALGVLGGVAMAARGVPGGAIAAWIVAVTGIAALRARSGARGERLARALVVLLVVYLAALKTGSIVARGRGLAAFARATGLGTAYPSTVSPAPAVPWRSTVVVATPETIHRVDVSLLEDPSSDEVAGSLERNLDDPLLAELEGTRELRAWRRFARHPFVRRAEGVLVLGDGRYSTGGADDWSNVAVPLRP